MRRSSSRVACSLGALLFACAGFLAAAKAADERDARLQQLARQASIEPYPVAMRAPPFRLARLQGDAASNADFKGKIVLLSFWASWCASCKADFPALERLQSMFDREDFEVVGIAVFDTPGSIRRFLGLRAPPFPILLDTDKKVAEQYRAAGVPVAYLLDRDGRIVAGKSGEHRWDDAPTIAVVRHLLAKSGM